MFAIVGIYPGVLRGLRLGHDRIGASNLAQQLLEEARVTPWDKLAPSSGGRKLDGVDYTYAVEVGPSPDGTPDVRLITVRVRWANQELALSTRLYHFKNP